VPMLSAGLPGTADAVVVGGGTVGAWCAYFLRQAGHSKLAADPVALPFPALALQPVYDPGNARLAIGGEAK
jgi:glycine/D-amino acid oxidase-like deaminating enzyme